MSTTAQSNNASTQPRARRAAVDLQRKVRAPGWLLEKEGITQKQWRARKRREMDAAIKALETFLCGAAYTPSAGEESCIGVILTNCRKLRAALSVKNWEGRRSNGLISCGANKEK